MNQPPGFEDRSGKVCLLERSLYGLKQAGNVWNQELNRVLHTIDFKQLKTDYCCYIKSNRDDFSILLLWPETKHDDTAIWTIISVAIVFSIIIYFFYLFNS